MAAQVKQMLNSLSNAGGSHKDITGKYRDILENIFKFQGPSLTEGLKTFIEAGKFNNIDLQKFDPMPDILADLSWSWAGRNITAFNSLIVFYHLYYRLLRMFNCRQDYFAHSPITLIILYMHFVTYAQTLLFGTGSLWQWCMYN